MLRTALALLCCCGIALGCAGSREDGAVSEQALQEPADSAVLDAVAATLKPTFAGQDVVVVTSRWSGVVRVEGDWAWVQAAVQLRDGGAPTTQGTSYQLAATVGLFDGWHVEALLHRDVEGTWRVVEHGLGDRDVWFWEIWERYPDADRALWAGLFDE